MTDLRHLFYPQGYIKKQQETFNSLPFHLLSETSYVHAGRIGAKCKNWYQRQKPVHKKSCRSACYDVAMPAVIQLGLVEKFVCDWNVQCSINKPLKCIVYVFGSVLVMERERERERVCVWVCCNLLWYDLRGWLGIEQQFYLSVCYNIHLCDHFLFECFSHWIIMFLSTDS